MANNKTKEQRKQDAEKYIKEHTKEEYKEEIDYCSLHKWLEKKETVSQFDALWAIKIALGEVDYK